MNDPSFSYRGPWNPKLSFWVPMLSLFILLFVSCTDQDNVSIGNTASGADVGILVDAANASGNINDLTFKGTNPSIDVGHLQESGNRNEIYALSTNRAPTLIENVTWTTSKDIITFSMVNEIRIPITFWVVQGTFSTRQSQILNEVADTEAIWEAENMGVEFSSVVINDATSDPDAGNFLNVNCIRAPNIRNQIGFTAGRINVYYVETTNGSAGHAWACGPATHTILMGGSTFNAGLLAHEIGHQMTLAHVDGDATNYDNTNVLFSSSSSREFLTDGQIIRSHFRPGSALNALYSARSGLTTRNCTDVGGSQKCPPRVKRIWSDGTFPAN